MLLFVKLFHVTLGMVTLIEFTRELLALFFLLCSFNRRNFIMSEIIAVKGDITLLQVDAIVNAANKSLLGGFGVDGAIHAAAGPGLLEECRNLHGCVTGQAKMTDGYQLPAKKVIHTVGPVYHGRQSDDRALAKCYYNSLELARQHNLHSIAFPAISTGVYHFPAKRAAKIAVDTIFTWNNKHVDYEMRIILCAFDQKTYKLYNQEIRKH